MLAEFSMAALTAEIDAWLRLRGAHTQRRVGFHSRTINNALPIKSIH